MTKYREVLSDPFSRPPSLLIPSTTKTKQVYRASPYRRLHFSDV